MFDLLTVGIAAAALLVVIWELVLIARNRPMDDFTVWALAVVELAVITLSVTSFVLLAGTDRDVSAAIFITYLIATPLVLPAGVLWAAAERTRSGTAVVLVATLAMPALMLRIHTVWAGG
jgi:hypothetical protein